jgi:two-component system chemotaxis sensor kinase CheA
LKSREREYKEIFIAEALEEYDALNHMLTLLEKDRTDDKLLAEIFRLLHNLKANARAIGFNEIADLAHKLESVFTAIRSNNLKFSGKVSELLFSGIDTLGEMIRKVDSDQHLKADKLLIQNLENLITHLSEDALEESELKQITGQHNIAFSELIYIPIRKLDNILNPVGELIIDRDRIQALSKEIGNEDLKVVSAHLQRISSELQESVMDARLVNVGHLFNKFPRIVRDIATSQGKNIQLEITGQDIQIDRNILQILADSLLHMVRNAITHGLESPDERVRMHKPEEGQLRLSARSDKDSVVIEITDDGKGIDVNKLRQYVVQSRFLTEEKAATFRPEELYPFIFETGFSMAEAVTEDAGRGVGLDVVKNAIDTLGGRIVVKSEAGKGTTFSLYVPTSIAVKGALLFELRKQNYAIPLIHTEAVVTMPASQIHRVGQSMVVNLKGETLPVINLSEIFFGVSQPELLQDTLPYRDMVVVTYNSRKLGLLVDKLLRQQDIVVKPLKKPVDESELFGGVTLLGTGEVCLVIDVPSLSYKYMRAKENAAKTIINEL